MTTKRTDDKDYKRMPIIFPNTYKKHNKKTGKISNVGRWAKRNKMKMLVVFLVLDLIYLVPASISLYQMSRYEVDVYDCSDMTKDCYAFFSNLGFNVTQMHGEPDGSDPGDYLEEKGQRYVIGHRWLRFHFPWGYQDFECTTLQFRDVASDWDIVWEYEK